MNALRQTEQAILSEGREWTRRRLAAQLQHEADALPLLCPQSGAPLTNTRRRDLQLDTVVGRVELRVRVGWSESLGGWVNPVRHAWGLEAYQRASPELQARLAYTATEVLSYERAAKMAATWGTPLSDGRIHHHIQTLGATAETLDLPAPPPPPREPEFSLVIQMDGWLARERGPDWGAGPRKKSPQRIAWHEIKSAVIYRLEQRVEKESGRGLLVEKFIVAVPPQTRPVDFGAAVQAEARRRGLGRARFIYVVMDGAVWLWDLAEDRFATAVKTLDFHHASEHLWAVAHALHGEGTPEARAWVEPLLHSLRHGDEARVVRRLEELLTRAPSDSGPAAARRASPARPGRKARTILAREVAYFQRHREHLHYEALAEAGAPIGSGAVESLCGQLQARFKGRGQFWERAGLKHLLAVHVVFQNRDDPHLWN
jgi:hypothetical protein